MERPAGITFRSLLNSLKANSFSGIAKLLATDKTPAQELGTLLKVECVCVCVCVCVSISVSRPYYLYLHASLS